MKRRDSRRRVKKRKAPGEKTRMKFGAIVGIMFVAVLLGFLTARFVVGPIIGYDSDTSPAKTASTEESEEDSENTTENTSENKDDSKEADRYALQFGAFSTEDAAKELVADLSEKGIKCEIVKDDSMYKVISQLVQTKDEALEELEDISDKEVEDVFIAKFN